MKVIVEKQLGITGDYQYRALRGKNYLQANWHNNKLSILKKLINEYKPNRILDLGTGSGNFELMFSKNVKDIVGIDYNEDALKFLRSQLKKRGIKNVKLAKNDFMKNQDFSLLGKFDLIVMIDVIEHIDMKSITKMVAQFKKILNKNGKVIIVTPNYAGVWTVIEKIIDTFTRIPHLEDMQHITKLDNKKLDNLFKRNGFTTIHSSTFNTFAYFFPNRKVAAELNDFEESLALPFGGLTLAVFEIK